MRTRIYRLSEKHTKMNELFNIAKIEKGLFGFIIYYIKIPQMGIFFILPKIKARIYVCNSFDNFLINNNTNPAKATGFFYKQYHK